MYIRNTYQVLIFGILVSIGKCADHLTQQPDFLPSCQIHNNPNFVQCSTNSIQQLFKKLKTGIPGLSQPNKIEPFYVKRLRFDQTSHRVASFNADLTNMVIYGMGDIIIKESKVSSKDYSWATKILVPKLTIESDYKLDGNILFVALQGNGKLKFEIDNADVLLHTKTRLYEKGGFTFYNVTNVKIDIAVTGLKSKLTNLFNGNEDLGRSVNELFNENWKEVFIALKPILMETIQEILLSLLQRVFHFIPANFFVTDIPTSIELYG